MTPESLLNVNYKRGAMQLFLAQSLEERESIYKLRYQAYYGAGAIDHSASQQFADAFDERPNCCLFGVRKGGVLLGSMRVLVSSRGGRDLTAYGAFGGAIEATIPVYERVLEANRLVINPDVERGAEHRTCMQQLFRTVVIAWLVFDADRYIAAVRPRHVDYYSRKMLMVPISEARDYPGLVSTPMVLLSGRCRNNYAGVCKEWGNGFALTDGELSPWKKQLLEG